MSGMNKADRIAVAALIILLFVTFVIVAVIFGLMEVSRESTVE